MGAPDHAPAAVADETAMGLAVGGGSGARPGWLLGADPAGGHDEGGIEFAAGDIAAGRRRRVAALVHRAKVRRPVGRCRCAGEMWGARTQSRRWPRCRKAAEQRRPWAIRKPPKICTST